MPEYIEAKSILSPLKNGPDPYFGIKYNMNLYRGCQHQCIYCDSRSTIYNIGNFSKIRIKKNATHLLENKLKKLRNKGTIGTGSMNDPYMPIEENEEITREALRIIAKYKFPIHILTKSDLVIRDIDLIREIGNTYAAVSFSITTSDDMLSKKLEPGATVTSKRIAAMHTLSQLGIYTGAVLTPVLPYITNTKENISRIINLVSKANGKYILTWMGLTQREGQREYFYNELDKHFNGLSKKYNSLFGHDYNCMAPNSTELYTHFNESCLNNNISTRMRFYNKPRPQQLTLFGK